MDALIAIACFLGGAVAGGVMGGLAAVIVMFAAVPPSGDGPAYKDIPKRLMAWGAPALAVLVVVGAVAAVRLQVAWQLHAAIVGAAIFGVAVFLVTWGWATLVGVMFQDAPE
jgi:hypothetical protein